VTTTDSGTNLAIRLHWLDLARVLALVGMIVFHFAYDLSMFGYIPPDVPFVPPFSILARAVAGSFLAMAGFSLYLAHGRGIRWRPFLRRLAVLTVAAAVITAATMIALPDFYIYFGILHSIALSSVLGLAFLRLPAWATLTVAAGIIALPFQIRFEMFDPAWLRFVGLGTITPFTADFEPLFPWFGVYLLGMALARMFTDMGWLRPRHAGSFIRSLGWIGRQSLWIYLAHQPILIGLIWVYAKAAGHI
tara:strand:- start:9589 stop:10332 length:744 start_codon:yes stop_codon:yes gene_type:complete